MVLKQDVESILERVERLEHEKYDGPHVTTIVNLQAEFIAFKVVFEQLYEELQERLNVEEEFSNANYSELLTKYYRLEKLFGDL